MIEDKQISALLTKSWKKSFVSGIIMPTTMKYCNECDVKKMCTKCDIQINENKEFEVNLDKIKRQPTNEFGHMLPHYKI